MPVSAALFGRAAIFARDMLCGIFAFWRHVGVQLKRVPVRFGGNVLVNERESLLNLLQANDAPWAYHVRNDIDAQRNGGGGHY